MIKTIDWQPACTPTSLYQRVLGEDADGLHPHVLALHCGPSDVHATGRLRVQRGRGLAGRLVGALLGMPATGGDVPTSLWISRHEETEHWVRQFDDRRPMRSWQRAGPPQTLVEQVGPLRFTFRLEVAEGGIGFTQRACHLVLGRLRLPIPTRLSPRVDAAARPTRDCGVVVSVRVASPLLGLLISYAGVVTIVERRR